MPPYYLHDELLGFVADVQRRLQRFMDSLQAAGLHVGVDDRCVTCATDWPCEAIAIDEASGYKFEGDGRVRIVVAGDVVADSADAVELGLARLVDEAPDELGQADVDAAVAAGFLEEVDDGDDPTGEPIDLR